MADLKVNKKKLTINLSLFTPDDHQNPNSNSSWAKSTTKSPKSFEPNGVVGLGIVAAMNDFDHTHDPFFSAKSCRAAILAVSPRSTPIPILNSNATASSVAAAAKLGGGADEKFAGPDLEEEMEMEMSEGYTCVISHIGNNLIKKREYFDGVLANESESSGACWVVNSPGLISACPPPPQTRRHEAAPFWAADFLDSCDLCKKQLHGLDIFMYRGEKAFCSAECRCKQISMDELKEKCGSGAMKPLEYSSVSPCSSPMQFFAGVAAA
ncbi:hypothetical protein U1Q18_026685 [Sarracenia purpurea var. burkii]